MNFLTIQNIAKSYGEITLFSNLSFSVHKGQKIGFIAKNGAGKTSILKILAKQETPDSGQINYRKGITLAFLNQDPKLEEHLTIRAHVFSSNHPTLSIIHSYKKALEHPENTKALQHAFELMEAHQAWDFETRYKQILSKLNINNLNQSINTLSGGEKKRLALAKVLITKPDVLILDEPTNHLDLEMIEWLEHFLSKESLTLFMVTHDRYFLEGVCDEILELDQTKLFSYKGNYSYFLEKRQARIEIQNLDISKTKQLYNKELQWIRRQPKARTTKSKSRIETFNTIKDKANQKQNDDVLQLEINMQRLGTKIIELHNVSKSFKDKSILQSFSYTFKRGERLGIIGKNGTGKTTFLNLITKRIAPDSGKIIIGETVKFGFYTQDGINVKPEQKVIDVIREFGDYIPLKKGHQLSAQQLLERFLFNRKKQYDFVEKLSGGERKRLFLCTILIQNPNVLILDEPTNDLDIVTLNVLENFLLDFPGCVIIVSHDRYFMDKIIDHLFVFKSEEPILDFPGNYSDFRVFEDNNKLLNQDNIKQKTEKKEWKKETKTKLSYNEQRELKHIEQQLKTLDQHKKEIEINFTNALSIEEINTLSQQLKTIIDNISKHENRWIELSSKLES